MPFDDPAALDLNALFRDANMFSSRHSWGAAGFRVIDRSDNGKIMVARHPSVQGLMFKKYASDISQKDQTKNYKRRVEGADSLRAFIDSRGLRRVTVPRKWLFELPRAFSRKETSHVLVVEQFDLLADDQMKAAYSRINTDLLAELCTVLHRFRGMDSIAKNIPFISDGRIGFIDTEHWDRTTSKPYLHRVADYMSKERRKLAAKILGQLEAGRDVNVGDFRDEGRSFRSGDFNNEEDTSSSSSSSSSSS